MIKKLLSQFTLGLIITFICLSSHAQSIDKQTIQAKIGKHLKTIIDKEMSALTSMACKINDRTCLEKELIERYRLDQWVRDEFYKLKACGEYLKDHKSECRSMLMGSTVFQIDLPNTRRLKEIMKAHNFPTPPNFSKEAQIAAWYIVQHAQFIGKTGTTVWDADLAESILPSVKKGIAAGNLTPWHYAAMFDRIALTRGKPQKFATQITCQGGKAVFKKLIDKNRIDEFRNEIGMKKFKQSDYDSYCQENEPG
ncbi:MAG: DUF6624 domain-containing protein [Kangiellaceae bacterium]|jgi:hypothetical protein|nr:DUF6624 domain-containing protein [Kangiellaceae bacterium]